MKKDVIQINGGITINAYVSVNFMYVKKIILGILLHAVVKMRNIQQVLWIIQQLHVMKLWNHIIKKQVSIKKKQPVKDKISIFYSNFY